MDDLNLDDIFAENCFLPCIGEVERKTVRKDLDTLLAELEVIKSNIEEIKAKEWYLADRMMKLNEGMSL